MDFGLILDIIKDLNFPAILGNDVFIK